MVDSSKVELDNTTEHRVRYSDTDSYGVVYYANYLRWIEAGRTEFFRKYLGKGPTHYEKEGLGFPFIDVHIKYHEPARMDEQITVVSILKEVKNTSAIFKFLIKKEGTLLCEVECVIVCVKDRFEKHPLPQEIKNLLN